MTHLDERQQGRWTLRMPLPNAPWLIYAPSFLFPSYSLHSPLPLLVLLQVIFSADLLRSHVSNRGPATFHAILRALHRVIFVCNSNSRDTRCHVQVSVIIGVLFVFCNTRADLDEPKYSTDGESEECLAEGKRLDQKRCVFVFML